MASVLTKRKWGHTPGRPRVKLKVETGVTSLPASRGTPKTASHRSRKHGPEPSLAASGDINPEDRDSVTLVARPVVPFPQPEETELSLVFLNTGGRGRQQAPRKVCAGWELQLWPQQRRSRDRGAKAR